MLCPECGTYTSDEQGVVCPKCGKLLERTFSAEEELMNFRQGRHLRKAEEAERAEREEAAAAARRRRSGASRSFEDTRPPETPEETGAAYGEREALRSTGRYYGSYTDYPDAEEIPLTGSVNHPTAGRMPHGPRKRRTQKITVQRVINWAHVLIGCVVLLMLLAMGVWLYLDKTASGQVIMARMGQDATAQAMWLVGNELLNTGEVEKAIEYFEIARAKDEEAKTPDATGLNLLGSAYEAAGDLDRAGETYQSVYTNVVPSDPEAYRNHVRVLLLQERQAEAAVLLQKAYQATKLLTFREQRLEILPEIPAASVIAGYYTEKKTVELSQAEDYSIYYTLNIYAELPAEGILYEHALELGEGEHVIRAVAVNGDLVSDEMEATYQIYMPTPLAPNCNLAPATYKKLRTVRLRPGTLTDEELEQNPGYKKTLDDKTAQTLTFYYTIDGSTPDLDSPIFDVNSDDVIKLPSGRVTLKAVAVNGYNKSSQVMERTYKFNVSPYPEDVYCLQDLIGDLKLGATSREAFLSRYGQTEMESYWSPELNTDCERYAYPWGYAMFMKGSTGWTLGELYMTGNEFSLPRSTRIGMTEKQVTDKFKDFGQVTSPSGNRGLYEDGNDKGKIYVQEDGGKIIRYRTGTANSNIWQLDYILDASGVVTSVRWLWER